MTDDDLDRMCPIHGCELLDGTAPMLYGFFGTEQNYGPASRNAFRYAAYWMPGGCSVAAGWSSEQAVRYCPRCREAERAWLEGQKDLRADESSWEHFLAKLLGIP